MINSGSDYNSYLVRLDSSGQKDNSFGTSGEKVSIALPGRDIPTSVHVLNDGAILVTGSTDLLNTKGFSMVRHLPNGDFDASFGSQGTFVSTSAPNTFRSLILPNSQIIAVGASRSSGAVAISRYLSNGILDATSASSPPVIGVSAGYPGVFEFDLSGIQSLLADDPTTFATDSLIENALSRLKLQLSYSTANLQFPTTVSLSQRAVVGNLLYFVAGSSGGQSLWQTDGTVVGTRQVLSPAQTTIGMTAQSELIVDGSTLVFSSGNVVWRYAPGTSPTLTNISNNAAIANISDLRLAEGIVLFKATESGAFRLFQIVGGSPAEAVKTRLSPTVAYVDSPTRITVFKADGVDYLAFGGRQSDNTNSGVWVFQPGLGNLANLRLSTSASLVSLTPADGMVVAQTVEGGRELRSIRPNGAVASLWSNPFADPQSITVVGQNLFFATTAGIHRVDLTTGFLSPTIVQQVEGSSTTLSFIVGQTELTQFKGKLFFTAVAPGISGELWTLNNSMDRAVLVGNINPTRNAGSSPTGCLSTADRWT